MDQVSHVAVHYTRLALVAYLTLEHQQQEAENSILETSSKTLLKVIALMN